MAQASHRSYIQSNRDVILSGPILTTDQSILASLSANLDQIQIFSFNYKSKRVVSTDIFLSGLHGLL